MCGPWYPEYTIRRCRLTPIRGVLHKAIILLKLWLDQRYTNQADPPSDFQLSLMLLHLVAKRLVIDTEHLQVFSYPIPAAIMCPTIE